MINLDAEFMTRLDRAWMRMEHPTNLMIVTVLLTTKTPIDYEHFKSKLEQRLSVFDRFTQRVVGDRWVKDKHFCFEDHILATELHDHNSEQELMALVGEQMSHPLDFNKPLWQIDVIDHYRTGSALIIRLHHCIGDGIAIVNMLLGITDPQDDKPILQPSTDTKTGISGQWEIAKEAVHNSQRKIQAEAQKVFEDPRHIFELSEQGIKFVNAWNKLAFIHKDSATPLKGTLGFQKCAAWSRPYHLDQIKRTGKLYNATINDVMLSAMSGALKVFLEEKNVFDPNLTINVISPVNFKPVRQLTELGNQFGLIFLSLPINVLDPIERLHETHERMYTIKHSPEAAISKGYLSTLGAMIKATQTFAIDAFCDRATAIFTNVPGPSQQLSLGGAEIDRAMFWVPQTGRMGLGISVMSYRNQICLAVASDRGLMPNPEHLIELFDEEMQTLLID